MNTFIDLTGDHDVVIVRKRKRETIERGSIAAFDEGFIFSEFAGDAVTMAERVMALLAAANLIKGDAYTLNDWRQIDDKVYFFNIFKEFFRDKTRLVAWTVCVTGATFGWLSEYKDARAREILREAPDGWRDLSEGGRPVALCAYSPKTEWGSRLGELGMRVAKRLDGWLYFF